MYIATLTILYPKDGWTALHLAAQEGKTDVVKLLINAEVQVNINIQTEVRTQCSIEFTHTTLQRCAIIFHGILCMYFN